MIFATGTKVDSPHGFARCSARPFLWRTGALDETETKIGSTGRPGIVSEYPIMNQGDRLVFIELPVAPIALDLRSTENCWRVYVLMSG